MCTRTQKTLDVVHEIIYVDKLSNSRIILRFQFEIETPHGYVDSVRYIDGDGVISGGVGPLRGRVFFTNSSEAAKYIGFQSAIEELRTETRLCVGKYKLPVLVFTRHLCRVRYYQTIERLTSV